MITGNRWFRMNWERFTQTMLAQLRAKFGIPETGYDNKTKPVVAILNHGNWLVVCPECYGAEYAFEEGWFFCCSCKNSKVGHKYRRFIFPVQRKAIEELMVVRPLDNRNWQLGETVAKLKKENLDHVNELLTKGGD